MNTIPTIKIDFVSDVACPWCAIGLGALEKAIQKIGSDISTEIHFQPFQLNPNMPPEGQDMTEHLSQKYGSTPAQQAQNYEAIRQRGAALGFEFRLTGRGRTWNTFDCHRLLHWAGELEDNRERTNGESIQSKLKKAMLKSYFTDGKNPAALEVLLADVASLGLDVKRATDILNSDEYTTEVRTRQRFYANNDIHGVPAIIINDKHLISGGQPVEVFEQALRQIAVEMAAEMANQ